MIEPILDVTSSALENTICLLFLPAEERGISWAKARELV